MRSSTALAGGLAGGFLAGRLLPIGIAALSGGLRTRLGEDPFELLLRQHRELLSLLDKMEVIPATQPAKRRALAYWLKRKLSKHAVAEENVIYPLLNDDAARQEHVHKLYAEHAEMKILLFELQREFDTGDGWVLVVRKLRDQIAPHARQEEEEEFPALRAVLDDQGKVRLGRQIHQYEQIVV